MISNVLFALGGAVAAVVSAKVYAWVKSKVVAPVEVKAAEVVAEVKKVLP